MNEQRQNVSNQEKLLNERSMACINLVYCLTLYYFISGICCCSLWAHVQYSASDRTCRQYWARLLLLYSCSLRLETHCCSLCFWCLPSMLALQFECWQQKSEHIMNSSWKPVIISSALVPMLWLTSVLCSASHSYLHMSSAALSSIHAHVIGGWLSSYIPCRVWPVGEAAQSK